MGRLLYETNKLNGHIPKNRQLLIQQSMFYSNEAHISLTYVRYYKFQFLFIIGTIMSIDCSKDI
jgi:hypothetical protein